MGKNVLIFSDGTGQVGGYRFDEERTNIYKLYRATRVGPDTSINPCEQVAFYDPGLGSVGEDSHFLRWIWRSIYNLGSKVTGFGITANIIDCYAALIRLWNPGDRILLFGFSRGAYTVRCLAEVIALCGIPTHLKMNARLRLDVHSSRKLASYAVKHVYQFTESRSYAGASDREKFLLDTRELLGRRFRQEFGSSSADGANAYPYFIGVFDTVASLGSFVKTALLALLLLGAAVILGFTIQGLIAFLTVGPIPRIFDWPISVAVVGAAVALAMMGGITAYLYTHIKFDFSVPDYDWKRSLRTIHVTELWQRFYDARLSKKVPYARHAISIDENRRDFKRVGWGTVGDPNEKDAHGHQRFMQVWFAGNHADVGGGYSENESRLADIALDWMLKSVSVIPNGIKWDTRVLTLWPHPEGMQHDEVKAGYGWLTRIFGWSWSKQQRALPIPEGNELAGGIIHRSVYKRFDREQVQLYDQMGPYRPETLRKQIDFAPFYREAAPFPATSERVATCVAAEPLKRGRKKTLKAKPRLK